MAIIDIEYGQKVLEEFSPAEAQPLPETVSWERLLKSSSYGHEYARLELETMKDPWRREDLMTKMESYKTSYFLARRYLEQKDPQRLELIEQSLLEQKVRMFGVYTA